MRAALAAASFAALSAMAFCSAADSSSASARKCSRTLTAAATSIELECVFFSVTPASGK
jgi:predicted DNA-binding ribbon-helix-helix protein